MSKRSERVTRAAQNREQPNEPGEFSIRQSNEHRVNVPQRTERER